MHNYECTKRLEDTRLLLHGFPRHQANLNPSNRANAGRWSENLNQPREHEAVMDSQCSPPSTLSKGLEEVKRHLESLSDQVRIAALKEALNYGKEGFQLVAKIIKTEKGVVQLTAYDLLWDKTNLKGKQKLLKYLSRHPEVCINYIEKVLKPSLSAMQEEQEQRHQTLAQLCVDQELIRQQYEQALLKASGSEQSYQDRSVSYWQTNLLGIRQDNQVLIKSELDAYLTKNPVSALVTGNPENPDQSAVISTNIIIGLKAQLDQQTALVKNLLPDLVLISKLFEAKAKKYLFEAQTFAKAIEQIEKAFLKLESDWQELESVTDCKKLPCEFLQRLETLISEIQEDLMVLRQTFARAITTQLQLQHHYNLAKKAAIYCDHRAKLDWQEGNQNWAQETLTRRKTYVDTATILKFSLEQQTPQMKAFKCHLFVLQSWLLLATEMKDKLKAQTNGDSAQVAQALLWRRIEFPYNTSSIMAKLERLEQEWLGEQ
ncbi:MAG TPA: PspA/IM30 family protein [Coleofasciculaceae cyanobacterium]